MGLLLAVLGGSAPGSAHAQTEAPAARADLSPAEAFFSPADIEDAKLSPGGRWLAIRTGKGSKRLGLVVFDLKMWKAHAVVASYGDADILECWWVNDARLVYDVNDLQRGGGDQRWWPGLFSVNADGTERRQLVRLERDFLSGAPRPGVTLLSAPHELLHVPGDGGDEVIVGEHRWDNTGEPDTVNAKRLNVVTGRATSISMGAPPHVLAWLFDPKGEPRVVVTQFKGRGAVHWRAPGQEAWKQLAEYPIYEAPFAPRYVDPEGNLFVTAHEAGSDLEVLKRFDFLTGRPAKAAVVSTPGFDFQGLLVSETPGSRALGIRVETDAESTVWFDPKLKAVQQQADARLPGHINRLTCRQCGEADMIVLVESFSDQDPGQYWVVRGEDWRKVGDRRSGIDPARMATVDFERVATRDGLPMPVWVTTPSRTTGTLAPRPTVVMVHGGPWVRGSHWRWAPMRQFLASRGYRVIEPEFRGSTGFGYRLFRAGWRQWGRAMQDDVADAVGWAVKKGLADPSRICIIGASYGGYATLMGLVRNPELYRCGAAWVAVTDPRLMFKWSATSDVWSEGREFDLPKLVGDPQADAAMLESVTPLLLADRIKAPLLLAVGGEDRRVPPEHGHGLRDAMRAAGHPAEYVEYPTEGHGWLQLETRVDFARRLEDFLARNLH